MTICMADVWQLNIVKSCEHATLLCLNVPKITLQELFYILFLFFLVVIELWLFWFV